MTWVETGLRGIDVSYWQVGGSYGMASGRDIDWPQVKAAGVQFVIIRIGDKDWYDPMMGRFVAGALRQDLAINTYHYLRFKLSPQRQAEVVLRGLEKARAEGLSAASRFWPDVEDPESYSGDRIAWLEEFLALMGEQPMGIYSGPGYWSSQMQKTTKFNQYPFWGAQYPFQDSQGHGRVPSLAELAAVNRYSVGGWGKDWSVWQYSSIGQIPGIQARVDLNVAKPGGVFAAPAPLDTLVPPEKNNPNLIAKARPGMTWRHVLNEDAWAFWVHASDGARLQAAQEGKGCKG